MRAGAAPAAGGRARVADVVAELQLHRRALLRGVRLRQHLPQRHGAQQGIERNSLPHTCHKLNTSVKENNIVVGFLLRLIIIIIWPLILTKALQYILLKSPK